MNENYSMRVIQIVLAHFWWICKKLCQVLQGFFGRQRFHHTRKPGFNDWVLKFVVRYHFSTFSAQFFKTPKNFICLIDLSNWTFSDDTNGFNFYHGRQNDTNQVSIESAKKCFLINTLMKTWKNCHLHREEFRAYFIAYVLYWKTSIFSAFSQRLLFFMKKMKQIYLISAFAATTLLNFNHDLFITAFPLSSSPISKTQIATSTFSRTQSFCRLSMSIDKGPNHELYDTIMRFELKKEILESSDNFKFMQRDSR